MPAGGWKATVLLALYASDVKLLVGLGYVMGWKELGGCAVSGHGGDTTVWTPNLKLRVARQGLLSPTSKVKLHVDPPRPLSTGVRVNHRLGASSASMC